MGVVERHRGDLLRLLAEGRIDILFANEAELLQLAGAADFGTAVNTLAPRVPMLVAMSERVKGRNLGKTQRAEAGRSEVSPLGIGKPRRLS